ncbi:hypothetical protein Syun_028186 [Stephania yunnanensis]|uniref:RNA helicase n=1 Tax=Stephania yunnanensis TaxID=152371 RepID=A0AAP0EJE7_9MAGN
MNHLFRKSASIASTASKQTLAALMVSIESLRLGPASAHSVRDFVVESSSTVEKLGLVGCGARGLHFSANPMEFRASVVARAEYAVDDFSDEERGSGKKAGAEDEGLEISKLGIAPEIVSALAKKGITKLFPIQRAVLEPAMQGRDMIGRAKTGTGKTLAFGIPILIKLLSTMQSMALVLAPTRELARQVEKEFHESASVLDTLCVYGGVPISRQMSTLDYGVDVVVGTPGRIIDLMKRGALNLSEVQFVVLDEADQMLAVGFDEDVEVILEKLPSSRQGMMFSATMPSWIRKLTQKYLKNPLTIDLVGESDQKLAEGITLYSIASDMYGKASIIGTLVTEHAKGGKCIVFVQTKRDADRLAYSMQRSFKCEALHGDISQNQRERTLSGFRDGHFNILVATDVAARGLDIPNVDLVVHYELPNSSEIFVHRSGRTGRAGKKGTAILIYTDQQYRSLRTIEQDVGCKFKELPKIAVDPASQSMFGGDMGIGGRDRGYGGRGDSPFGRSGGYGNSGFGRSGGFGSSSSGRSGDSSGRYGSFGGSSSGRFSGSSSSRSNNFGRSSGFGDSGGSSSGFGRSSGFGGSNSRRFGDFDDDFSDKFGRSS